MATITLSAKCSDLFSMSVHDDDGNKVKGYDGYVPEIKALGGGDYLELEIDISTGKIVGWEPLTVEDVLNKL